MERGEDAGAARRYVEELCDLTRIPSGASTPVMVGDLQTAVARARQSDLDILGARRRTEIDFLRTMVRATRSSCLFTSDSGQESDLA